MMETALNEAKAKERRGRELNGQIRRRVQEESDRCVELEHEVGQFKAAVKKLQVSEGGDSIPTVPRHLPHRLPQRLPQRLPRHLPRRLPQRPPQRLSYHYPIPPRAC